MIRPARPDDMTAMVDLIGELADYERARHEVRITDVRTPLTPLFGAARPLSSRHVAEVER